MTAAAGAAGAGAGAGTAAGGNAATAAPAPAAAPSQANQAGQSAGESVSAEGATLNRLGFINRSQEGQIVTPSKATATPPPANPDAMPTGDSIKAEHPEAQTTPVQEGENVLTSEANAEKKRLNETLKKFFPDMDFSDPAEAEEFTAKTLEDLFDYKKNNVKHNQLILDVFETEPAIVNLIKDMTKGASFIEALARNFDVDGLQPIQGDPDYDGWNSAKAERAERKKKADAQAKEFDDNAQFTGQEIQAFRTEHPDMDDDTFTKYATTVDDILKDAYKGKITRKFLNLLFKGLEFDSAVKTAKEQGLVSGKNQKIVAEKLKEETVGDGMPALRSSGGGDDTEPAAPATPDQVFIQDIEKHNRTRKSLESLLSDGKGK